MEISDFGLLRKGWNDKLTYEQQVLRYSTWIIHASLVGKPVNMKELWPLPGEEKINNDVSDRVKELLRMQKDGTLKDLLKKKKNA